MRVRARYLASQPKAKRRKKGGANHWYDGVISGKDESDGTYHVAYDDGTAEAGVWPEHLMVLGTDSEHSDEEADEEADEEGGSGRRTQASEAVGGVEADSSDGVELSKLWPKPTSLRHDALAALVSGATERSAVVDYVWEHGVASTRGNDDKTILRMDVVTLLGREAKRQDCFALWTQHEDRYTLSSQGERLKAVWHEQNQ